MTSTKLLSLQSMRLRKDYIIVATGRGVSKREGLDPSTQMSGTCIMTYLITSQQWQKFPLLAACRL